jgi:hypothetical protein
MHSMSTILIPEKSPIDKNEILNEVHTDEAFDGNIWKENIWLKYMNIVVSILIIILMTMVIEFSFSSLFGDQIWFALVFLKII